MGSRPKRRLHSTRSRLNLSSGLKRAGCALCVGLPSGATFCIQRAYASLRRMTLQYPQNMSSTMLSARTKVQCHADLGVLHMREAALMMQTMCSTTTHSLYLTSKLVIKHAAYCSGVRPQHGSQVKHVLFSTMLAAVQCGGSMKYEVCGSVGLAFRV